MRVNTSYQQPQPEINYGLVPYGNFPYDGDSNDPDVFGPAAHEVIADILRQTWGGYER